jgi:uncharacterized sporulation protein YeaH/YhbH (DUF444 family)
MRKIRSEEQKRKNREYLRAWRASRSEEQKLILAEKNKENCRRHRAANLEQSRASQREYQKKYRQANLEKVRAMHREYQKKWREANPQKKKEIALKSLLKAKMSRIQQA